jgi:hypothetical protein
VVVPWLTTRRSCIPLLRETLILQCRTRSKTRAPRKRFPAPALLPKIYFGFTSSYRSTFTEGNIAKMVRKLKHHEQKLLRKVDFTTYKSDNDHRDAVVIRRYAIQKPQDYRKYNLLVGVASPPSLQSPPYHSSVEIFLYAHMLTSSTTVLETARTPPSRPPSNFLLPTDPRGPLTCQAA